MKKELKVEITEQNYQRAIEASSGGCIVADAIKEKYPEFTSVKVDAATIRCSDRKAGERYVYLTPPSAVDTLLFFDQGWKEQKLPKKLRIRDLVRVVPIIRSASDVRSSKENRDERLAELQSKIERGETLTREEKGSLTRLQNYNPRVRPTAYGPTTVEGEGENIVIRGGDPSKVTGRANRLRKHPNMLAGRTRHFGEKHAEPSAIFKQAVKEAVLADRRKRRAK